MASRKLTPKQEAFALAYVELGNASGAYRTAYDAGRMKPTTVNRNAFALLQNGKIAARVDQLQTRAAKRYHVTVDSLVGELEEARELAMTSNTSTGAAVSATMGKGKLLGLVVDRSKVEGVVRIQELPALSPEAAARVLGEIEAEEL